MLSLLRGWWRRRSSPLLPHLQIVLYTRKGCHLCEVAWDRLEAARRLHGFQLAAVDIDLDPDLVARFGEQVPVVSVDGKIHFRGDVNALLLARILHAEEERTARADGTSPRPGPDPNH